MLHSMRAEQVERQLVQVVAAGSPYRSAEDGSPLAAIAQHLDEWEQALAAPPEHHRPGSRWVADWRRVMGLPGG